MTQKGVKMSKKKHKRKVFSINSKIVINPKNENSYLDSTSSSDGLFEALLFMSILSIRKRSLKL